MDDDVSGCIGGFVALALMAGLVVAVFLGARDAFCDITDCHKDVRDRHAAMVSELRPLLEACASLPESDSTALRGNLVVYKTDSNGESFDAWYEGSIGSDQWGRDDNWYDPSKSAEEEFTVLVVSTTKLEQVGGYQPEDCDNCGLIPAYEARFDICEISWPEKRAVGRHLIVSEPVDKFSCFQGGCPDEVVGKESDIAQWIDGLSSVDY
jgi:hypothetical protein